MGKKRDEVKANFRSLVANLRSYINDKRSKIFLDILKEDSFKDDLQYLIYLKELEQKFAEFKDLLYYFRQLNIISSVQEYLPPTNELEYQLVQLSQKIREHTFRVEGMGYSENFIAGYGDSASIEAEDSQEYYGIRLSGTYPQEKKIPLIKAIREFSGLGLKESKDFSESLPATFPSVYSGDRDFVRASVIFADFLDIKVQKVPSKTKES